MDELDHLGWVVHQSYEIGPLLVGIRTTSEALGAWLEQALEAYRTDEETDAVYSVLVPETSDRRPGKRFHMLYRESTALAKSLDMSLVIRALLAELEGFLFHARDDAVYTQAALVAAAGGTGLVPSLVVPYLATLGRGLERAGVALPLAAQTAIDCESGFAMPIRPLLDVDARAFDRLRSISEASDRERLTVLDEPTKVDAVCSIGLDDQRIRRVSRAYALFQLAEKASNLQKLGPTALDGLRQLIEGARCYELRTANVEGTRDALLEALCDATGQRAAVSP